MPSDLAKKKAAKKKEAAKARQRSKKPEDVNEENDQAEPQQNGADSNGRISMDALKRHQKPLKRKSNHLFWLLKGLPT